MKQVFNKEGERAGYARLLDRFDIAAIPNWHESRVGEGSSRQTEASRHLTIESFPATFWPGDSDMEHLEFALKYDGTNLAILAQIFGAQVEDELVEFILATPTGKYARRIWFLYEFLTGQLLPIDDLKFGNYLPVLDENEYFVVNSVERVSRQRVINNLLGVQAFCPTVRRTKSIANFERQDLAKEASEVTSRYSPDVFRRALSYLYLKETKSSFEIEQEHPSPQRAEKFIALLRQAETEDLCSKVGFIDAQNRIVDERFAATDYRDFQNYVGTAVEFNQEVVHYVPPSPEAVGSLMDALVETNERTANGGTPAVVRAAVIAYGFVFMHPFEDGNGRIHRVLVHNILALSGFTPPGIMFPISATMLKHLDRYDESLEAFSKPLLSLIDFHLDDVGMMGVENETALWYRYMDMTAQVEALCGFVKTTIHEELAEELDFLSRYDRARTRMRAVVDAPDQKMDLLIRVVVANQGRLARIKRKRFFDFLTDDEVARLEQIIQEVFVDEPS